MARRKMKDDLLDPPKKRKRVKPAETAVVSAEGRKGPRPGSRKYQMYNLFKEVGVKKRIETLTKHLDCTPKALGELVSDLKNPRYSNPVITLTRDGDVYERTA